MSRYALAVLLVLPAIAPAQAALGDWPSYNRTLTGERFSPLAEINRANVARMYEVCTYTLPEVTSLQTGPIVVNGTMYFTTDTISYAIDGSTCAEKWKQVRHSDTPSALAVHRGFAYANGRLFRGTSDVHVIALDTTDGHLIWDQVLDAKGPGVSLPMAPVTGKGVVYVGNAGGDQAGVTGHVYALATGTGTSSGNSASFRIAARPVRRGPTRRSPSPAVASGRRSRWTRRAAYSTCRRAIPRPTSTSRAARGTISTATR